MRIFGSFLTLEACGMSAYARIVYALAEAAGNLQEWLLNCSGSYIACRVWHLYVYVEGCANLIVEACQLH